MNINPKWWKTLSKGYQRGVKRAIKIDPEDTNKHSEGKTKVKPNVPSAPLIK